MLAIYDSFMIPFRYTVGSYFFKEETLITLDMLDYVIKAIFALDVVLSFRKAYYVTQTGKEVRDPKKIAARYLKFFFWVDILSAFPFAQITGNVKHKGFSMFKLLRLIRLSKITSLMKLHPSTRSRIRVMYLVISMIIWCHWVTCYMYYTANNEWLVMHVDYGHNDQTNPLHETLEQDLALIYKDWT